MNLDHCCDSKFTHYALSESLLVRIPSFQLWRIVEQRFPGRAIECALVLLMARQSERRMMKLPEENCESILRQEIIESEKTQADFLKWKLISVASIASVFLSFKVANTYDLSILLCIVPLICTYVDLISVHLMLRIVLIGTYLRKTKRKLGHPDYLDLKDYETFVADILGEARDNPFSLFGLELAAIHGSTLVFSIIILTYGFVLASSNSSLAYLYLVSGIIGIIFTTLLFATFGKRVRKIIVTPIERKSHSGVHDGAN
jgi:hypothetical protein